MEAGLEERLNQALEAQQWDQVAPILDQAELEVCVL
jgi:hypothetical protein